MTSKDEHRPDLGARVRSRRHALGMTIRDATQAAGVSDQTWANVEAGKKVSDRTLAQVQRALRWPVDYVDAVLAGRQPPPEEPVDQSPTDAMMERFDRLEAELVALREELGELRRERT